MAILALFFYLLALSITSTSADFFDKLCQGGGNYTAKSPFQSNLNLLLSSLSSTNATFFTDTKGSAPVDPAYGLVLCGGNVGPTDCTACLKTAAIDVLVRCPLSKQATVWYDNCQLRYSDVSFFSTFDSSNVRAVWNGGNATEVGSFVELDTRLLDAVSNAAASSSLIMFATGIATNRSVDSNNGQQTVYAQMQCTRDLSTEDCGRCLQQIRGGNFNWVWARRGARVFGQSCNFRYETYPFFNGKPTVSLDLSPSPPPPPPPPPAPAPPPPASNNEKGNHVRCCSHSHKYENSLV